MFYPQIYCNRKDLWKIKKTVEDILLMIKEKDVKMVDFKMVDINGQFRLPVLLKISLKRQ